MERQDDGGGILIWGLIMGILFMFIGIILWIRSPSLPPGKVTITCGLTCPSIAIQEGWHCYAPEDRDYLNLKAGQIEFKYVDNLVSCTRYESSKTPTEFKAAMQMWRKR